MAPAAYVMKMTVTTVVAADSRVAGIGTPERREGADGAAPRGRV
eukprot:gene824-60943_t